METPIEVRRSGVRHRRKIAWLDRIADMLCDVVNCPSHDSAPNRSLISAQSGRSREDLVNHGLDDERGEDFVFFDLPQKPGHGILETLIAQTMR